MLGGSSALNGMIYARGSSDVYNKWAELGNSGWDYESILPYFKKFEGNQNASLVAYANGRYHSANGPVKIESGARSSLADAYAAALKSAGVVFIPDANADQRLGHVFLQTFASNGRRSSTAEAYLHPIRHRPNLDVIKHAYVKKVLINRENVAYGVEIMYKKKHLLKAYSRKEVIVSAGAIQSPPLLMRSGIGPRNYLENLDIPCKADLAVGENFIDHPIVYLTFTFNVSTSPVPPSATLDSLYQYEIHRSGPLGPSSYFSALLDTTKSNDYFNATMNGTPDIQLFYSIYPRGSSKSAIEAFNRYTAFEKLDEFHTNAVQYSDVLFLAVTLVAPKSRGFIGLNKGSKRQDSIIYSNFLGDPRDRDTLMIAVKQQIALLESPALRRIGSKFLRPPLAECDTLEYPSDAYWQCYMKYSSCTCAHQHGTSKMGNDRKSVVDPRLRVYGVTGLRQADMGVVPIPIDANTCAAAMMIGEKGADIIKEDYLNGS